MLSRRSLLHSTAAALAGSTLAPAALNAATPKPAGLNGPVAPFKSMRDFIAALEARGLVVRIPEVNQDEYEAAALMYRMSDQNGMRGAPALLFEKVRIDGEWIEGHSS